MRCFNVYVNVFCHVYNVKTVHRIGCKIFENWHYRKFVLKLVYKFHKIVLRFFENRSFGLDSTRDQFDAVLVLKDKLLDVLVLLLMVLGLKSQSHRYFRPAIYSIQLFGFLLLLENYSKEIDCYLFVSTYIS